VALVSKSWNQAERAAALQPTHLTFFSIRLSALKWQIRDTTKLHTVNLDQSCMYIPLTPKMYRSGYASNMEVARTCTKILLTHLAADAPALRVLAMTSPKVAQDFSLWQLLGRLTQLETITIHNWEYAPVELLSFGSLASLQKLQVPQASSILSDSSEVLSKITHR